MNPVHLYARLINGPDDEREALIEEYRVRMNCAQTEEERRRWELLICEEASHGEQTTNLQRTPPVSRGSA